MIQTPKSAHPEGEAMEPPKTPLAKALEVDTFDGKLHVEWDPSATVTPLGQLQFFIQFLKLGYRFEPWVEDCPLSYSSPNAPTKTDVLGSLLLSVLSGHTRYSHITTLTNDTVNFELLGMNKVVSDDSARRALKTMDDTDSTHWLQSHLHSTYAPLLSTPWILDADVTVKPLYGHQQGAVVGHNAKKPGRPSQTYHTYTMANLRLVLDVHVQAGNQSHSMYSLPGLVDLLNWLSPEHRPAFVRGDCDWGSDRVMRELEGMNQDYLFKLKKSKQVKALISKHHSLGEWRQFSEGWQAKADYLQLGSWNEARRVVILRRRVSNKNVLAVTLDTHGQQDLAFIDHDDVIQLYEYSVLVTNLDDDAVTLVQHYRDRADCENVFDEIKNQWGWGGFTTQDLGSCQRMTRIIALIYNWWSLFVRLANPDKHTEAITSRPLLLSSIGRLTKTGRQKRMVITSSHAQTAWVEASYRRMAQFFDELKRTASQLSPQICWARILANAMSAFDIVIQPDSLKLLAAPT